MTMLEVSRWTNNLSPNLLNLALIREVIRDEKKGGKNIVTLIFTNEEKKEFEFADKASALNFMSSFQ